MGDAARRKKLGLISKTPKRKKHIVIYSGDLPSEYVSLLGSGKEFKNMPIYISKTLDVLHPSLNLLLADKTKSMSMSIGYRSETAQMLEQGLIPQQYAALISPDYYPIMVNNFAGYMGTNKTYWDNALGAQDFVNQHCGQDSLVPLCLATLKDFREGRHNKILQTNLPVNHLVN